MDISSSWQAIFGCCSPTDPNTAQRKHKGLVGILVKEWMDVPGPAIGSAGPSCVFVDTCACARAPDLELVIISGIREACKCT